MALPNHPDVCYEFVKTLKECGYRWVLLQEHSVERIEDGGAIRNPHIPHRLVARNSSGQIVSIVALIKTQGSDTKLVGQMQPYYEAKGLKKMELGGRLVPQLSVQISDGENGGVMMNEFVPKFLQVMHESANSRIPAMNGTEYLEHLEAAGVREDHLPVVQPVHQKRIWDRLESAAGPEKLEALIEQIRKEDHRFNMDGGSWTDNISWVKGYEGVLTPMRQASAPVCRKDDAPKCINNRPGVSHRAVSPAAEPDELLPVLGRRDLGRLRARILPAGDGSDRIGAFARDAEHQSTTGDTDQQSDDLAATPSATTRSD